MDFFSNIIKTTINKVTEQSAPKSESSVNETDAKTADDESNQLKGTPKTKKKIMVDGDALKSPDDSIDDGIGYENRIRRSSSGDTSGPDDAAKDGGDDAVNEGTDQRKESVSEAMGLKALESAKSFGNFLYNVANKAGQTVSATAKQLKHSVEQSGIVSDFTKEQQEFIKEHGGKIDCGEPPWIGCDNEEAVKERVLTLSQDKRNFVRSPPTGVQFQFDMETAMPIALALLKEDPNLNVKRFEIVPKLVNEESFWRNYFYRVSLIKQSAQFSTVTGNNKGWTSSRSSSGEGPDDPNDPTLSADAPEFISDSFQNSDAISEDDLRKGMRQLGMESKDIDDLEAELSKDLQEFEVVAGDAFTIDDAELEKELQQLES